MGTRTWNTFMEIIGDIMWETEYWGSQILG